MTTQPASAWNLSNPTHDRNTAAPTRRFRNPAEATTALLQLVAQAQTLTDATQVTAWQEQADDALRRLPRQVQRSAALIAVEAGLFRRGDAPVAWTVNVLRAVIEKHAT